MISLVLALLAQPTNPMESSEIYYIEDFGGGPNQTAATNTTAITNALAHLAANNQADGGEIRFNCGEYNFNATITIGVNVRLVGQTGQQYSCTTLKFPNDTSGIVFSYPSSTQYDNANGAIIEKMEIEGGGSASSTAHGITVNAPNVVIRDVRVRLFPGNCVTIRGDINDVPVTNANLGKMTNVETVNCGEWCVHVSGGDSNAWLFQGNNLHACTTGTLYEDSFIGNTWIGNHFDTEGDCGDADPNTFCGIKIPDTSNRVVFLGNYIEGSLNVDFSAPSVWLAGYGGGELLDQNAYFEQGNVSLGQAKVWVNDEGDTEMRTGNVKPGTGYGILEFDVKDGYTGNPNCVYPASPSLCDRDPQALRFGYEPGVTGTTDSLIGWWCYYPENESGNSMFCLATDRVDDHDTDYDGLVFEPPDNDPDESDDPEEKGQLWIRGNGYWLGGASNLNSNAANRRILVAIDDEKPTRTDLPPGSFIHYSPPPGERTSIMGWLWNGNKWIAK